MQSVLEVAGKRQSVTSRACYASDVGQERVPRTLHMTLIPHPTPTPRQRAILKKVAKRTYGFAAVGINMGIAPQTKFKDIHYYLSMIVFFSGVALVHIHIYLYI